MLANFLLINVYFCVHISTQAVFLFHFGFCYWFFFILCVYECVICVLWCAHLFMCMSVDIQLTVFSFHHVCSSLSVVCRCICQANWVLRICVFCILSPPHKKKLELELQCMLLCLALTFWGFNLRPSLLHRKNITYRAISPTPIGVMSHCQLKIEEFTSFLPQKPKEIKEAWIRKE